MKKLLLNECLRIAKQKLDTHPELNNYPHYSFVICDNKILGFGTNLPMEPPIHLGYHKKHSGPKLHAEINAFKRCKGIIKKRSFDIVNIRLSKDGQVKMAKPCDCCYSLLKELKCQTFWFSTKSNKFEKIS